METFEYGDLPVLNTHEVTVPLREQIVTDERQQNYMRATEIIAASVSITVKELRTNFQLYCHN